MFGRAVGYIGGAVLAVALAVRFFGRLPLRRRVRGEPDLRAIGVYAGAALIVNAAYTAFAQIDVILIGAYLGATAAGLFQAPLRLTAFLQYPAAALAAAATPRLARGAGQEPDVGLFVRAIRYVALIQAFLVVPAIVWSKPIMDLVAPSYDRSASVLRGLAPYIYLQGFAVLFSLGANYLGEVRRRVPIGIAVLVLNLVIDVILIPRIGIVGGAIGTDIAFAVFVPGHIWICLRHIDLPLRTLLVSLARTLLAGAAMALVLALVGTSHLSAADWFVGAVGGSLAFAAVILATGEISRSELAWLRSRGRRA
jgi:O-antigen/teichoic acid export membrane protein